MPKATRKAAGNGVFNKTTLKNGMRVISEKLPSVRSVSIGVWVDVGSRYEKPEENGLSHFIEHMVFKGTRKRNARQVGASLESLGGSLNAFTTREVTCYYARILDENLVDAVDVLSDIVCNATFSPTNIAREKTVIVEEIKEANDTPSDKIHDEFSKSYWGRHPLGQPIMGSRKNIMGMPRARLLNYVNRQYRTGSVVIAAAGSLSHRKLIRLAQEKFNLPEGLGESSPPAVRNGSSRLHVEKTGGFQTHLCVGFPGLSFSDNDRMIAAVLGSHLGTGMSSVLFQRIREERGLAYSVYTFHDHYRDAGVFGAYLGTDKKSVRHAFDLMMREFEIMKKRAIPAARLHQVKTLIKGNLSLAMESTSSHMNRIARQELMMGDFMDNKKIMNLIDRVTAAEVRDLARRMLDFSQMTTTVLGPVDQKLFKDVG